MSLLDPVREGDALAGLRALRDAIVADLDVCESMRDRAALYTRLTTVMAELREAEPAEQKGDAVDEIAARRAARRSGASSGAARAKH